VFVVSVCVLASEIGGVSIALQMATGIAFRWWAMPVAIIGWLLLWGGTFGVVEKGAALLGLVAISFGVGAIKLHPQWSSVGAALMPTVPSHDRARYWYIAVSILGASISPYLYLFYSAGAIEDEWTTEHLMVNRVTALLGNLFGGTLAAAALVGAAVVLAPRHIKVEHFEQIALVLASPLGRVGFVFFIATLFITCFGATLEITLAVAYLLAQGFGWNWSMNLKPGKDARFSAAYSLLILMAAIPIALGADPLALTNISMTLTAASLPITVIPLIVLMNDGDTMATHVNGWVSNIALIVIGVISIVLLLVALPLQLSGGG
jgi:Mn2+/Fe2+ NRAMP family transporter